MIKPLDDFNDLIAKGRALRTKKVSPSGGGKFLDGNAQDDQATVELECATNITPEPIVWLWKHWLARGKLHVLAGIPGVGKSTIAFKIAAAVSSGGRLPGGIKSQEGAVIIWSAEDDAKDTIRPRLEASGADLSQVHIVRAARDRKGKRAFDPSRDVAGLLAAIKAIGGAAMIIVDPIVLAVAKDSHKNAETRRDLQPLVDLAAELGAALLGVTHFTKGSEGRQPIDRVTGSLAFGALSRVVWVAAQKQDDDEGKPGARVLMLAKSNIGPDKGGFEYDLQNLPLYSSPDIIASIVVWGDRVEGTARDILAEAETVKVKDENKATALREAKDFLLDLLVDGPMPTKEIVAAAREAKQSWRTIERAKSELKISTGSRRDGYPWSLPRGGLRHEKHELYPKTLADLADIEKAKKNKGLNPAKNSANRKTLADMVGGDEPHQYQHVSQTPPTPPSPPIVLEAANSETGDRAQIPTSRGAKVRVRI
jgi:putative DNA primase/helicase